MNNIVDLKSKCICLLVMDFKMWLKMRFHVGCDFMA